MNRLMRCSGCKTSHSPARFSKNQKYCKEYAAKWRAKHRDRLRVLGREWKRRNPAYYGDYQRKYQKKRKGTRKVRARMLANLAFRGDGRVLACSDCGATTDVDKAHVSYYKPLVVVPLCRVHHRLFDRSRVYRASMRKFAVKAK